MTNNSKKRVMYCKYCGSTQVVPITVQMQQSSNSILNASGGESNINIGYSRANVIGQTQTFNTIKCNTCQNINVDTYNKPLSVSINNSKSPFHIIYVIPESLQRLLNILLLLQIDQQTLVEIIIRQLKLNKFINKYIRDLKKSM